MVELRDRSALQKAGIDPVGFERIAALGVMPDIKRGWQGCFHLDRWKLRDGQRRAYLHGLRGAICKKAKSGSFLAGF